MNINFIQQSITEMKQNLNVMHDREGDLRFNAEELYNLLESGKVDKRFDVTHPDVEPKDRMYNYMHGQTVFNVIANTSFPKGMLEIRIGHWVGVFNYKENKNG